MKVIVIRQPWAWLIVKGHKDVENRNWETAYRGPLLIQASGRRPTRAEMKFYTKYANKRGVVLPEEFDFGGIVGMVRMDDCVSKSTSKWFEGRFGWVFSKPKILPFVPMKGQLRLFDPPVSVVKKLGLA